MTKAIDVEQNVKPPLPPKGEAAIPKPPPRRTKGRSAAPSPVPFSTPSPSLSQRSNTTSSSMSNNSAAKPPVVPQPNWTNVQGRNSTLNRPLPPPPTGKSSSHQPVEPAVRTSVFDSIKRPPSVAMEKIKSSTAAALDRMVQLQQRYRQHQETMRDDASHRSSISDRNTGTSLNGSMSSGIDSIPFRPPQVQSQVSPPHAQMSRQGFDALPPQPRMAPNPWGTPTIQQTQSMAHLNFMGNQPHGAAAWNHPAAAMAQQQQMWMNQQMNHSNMSLNMPNQGFGTMDDGWNQQGWGSMFPFPMYPYPGD